MKKSMSKRMIIMLITVVILFGGLIGYQMFVANMMKQFMMSNASPPATVTVIEAQQQLWQPQQNAVGTLRAVQGVMITSEVSGVVKQLHFKSGTKIKQGQLLLELNADEELAQLAALTVNRKLAEQNLERNQKLSIKAISQAQLDASEAELKRLQAEEKRLQVIISKKQIRAPFSGMLGVTTISIGQLINQSQPIVLLQNREQLYVDFNLPQNALTGLKSGLTIHINNDSGTQKTGVISAINAVVDSKTRNMSIEGKIDNQDEALLPGMFVNVKVDIGKQIERLTLPQTAVSYTPYGSTIFIARAKEGEKQGSLFAQQVFVKTGEKRGDQIAILEGVHVGEKVVTSGQMKLTNGTPLIINNDVVPTNDADPRPQEM